MIIPIFNFLEKYFTNYGIIIIFLLVLIIKMLLMPLTYKSYLSMAKMKVLKPEIDAIKEKHAGRHAKNAAGNHEAVLQRGRKPDERLYSDGVADPDSVCHV